MLKAGGILVYSTCTFAPEEDEQNIAWLLKEYPALEMVDIKKFPGMDDGRPDWADGNPELAKAVRLFPHHYRGEGHFIAKLRLRDQSVVEPSKQRNQRRKKHRGSTNNGRLTKDEQQLFIAFQNEYLSGQSWLSLVINYIHYQMEWWSWLIYKFKLRGSI